MIWRSIRRVIRFGINALTIIVLVVVALQAGMQIQRRLDLEYLFQPIRIPPPIQEFDI